MLSLDIAPYTLAKKPELARRKGIVVACLVLQNTTY